MNHIKTFMLLAAMTALFVGVGYLIGGTSPFALRKPMPVFVEASVLELPRICINGGRRGYLVGIAPEVLVRVLAARPVRCASAE